MGGQPDIAIIRAQLERIALHLDRLGGNIERLNERLAALLQALAADASQRGIEPPHQANLPK